jgi:hypothetical protein
MSIAMAFLALLLGVTMTVLAAAILYARQWVKRCEALQAEIHAQLTRDNESIQRLASRKAFEPTTGAVKPMNSEAKSRIRAWSEDMQAVETR